MSAFDPSVRPARPTHLDPARAPAERHGSGPQRSGTARPGPARPGAVRTAGRKDKGLLLAGDKAGRPPSGLVMKSSPHRVELLCRPPRSRGALPRRAPFTSSRRLGSTKRQQRVCAEASNTPDTFRCSRPPSSPYFPPSRLPPRPPVRPPAWPTVDRSVAARDARDGD